ncbi:MAG: hypothetical protein MUF14_01095 [Hyphomonadaceae bacterium]|nr:hypothetical protein [Hyphomonadaceae bacterium]
MTRIATVTVLSAMLALNASCAGRQANHIGALWTWPGAIVSSGISNAVYDARRARVKAYVTDNVDAIASQATEGTGATLDEAARIAGVPSNRRPDLYRQLRDSHADFFAKPTREEVVEAVTIAFMVYSSG